MWQRHVVVVHISAPTQLQKHLKAKTLSFKYLMITVHFSYLFIFYIIFGELYNRLFQSHTLYLYISKIKCVSFHLNRLLAWNLLKSLRKTDSCFITQVLFTALLIVRYIKKCWFIIIDGVTPFHCFILVHFLPASSCIKWLHSYYNRRKYCFLYPTRHTPYPNTQIKTLIHVLLFKPNSPSRLLSPGFIAIISAFSLALNVKDILLFRCFFVIENVNFNFNTQSH